jgi:hypothetical protein
MRVLTDRIPNPLAYEPAARYIPVALSAQKQDK